MPTTLKSYTVDYFAAQVAEDREASQIAVFLNRWMGAPATHTLDHDGHLFLITHLGRSKGMIAGVFGKLRISDLPRVGDRKGNEQDLPIKDGQGLIEKNHFLYDPRRHLLVWQVNKSGTTVNTFSRYLTSRVGFAVSFNPVLAADAAKKFLAGNRSLKQLELTFAKPSNPEMYSALGFGQDILNLLASSGGMGLRLSISANRQGQSGNSLSSKFKTAVADLVGIDGLKRAQVTVDGPDGRDIYDLVADRLRAKMTVEMKSRYPDQASIFREMRSTTEGQEKELSAQFGAPGNALD